MPENALLSKFFVIFKKQCSQVSEDSDINYMAALVFQKCLFSDNLLEMGAGQ